MREDLEEVTIILENQCEMNLDNLNDEDCKISEVLKCDNCDEIEIQNNGTETLEVEIKNSTELSRENQTCFNVNNEYQEKVKEDMIVSENQKDFNVEIVIENQEQDEEKNYFQNQQEETKFDVQNEEVEEKNYSQNQEEDGTKLDVQNLEVQIEDMTKPEVISKEGDKIKSESVIELSIVN